MEHSKRPLYKALKGKHSKCGAEGWKYSSPRQSYWPIAYVKLTCQNVAMLTKINLVVKTTTLISTKIGSKIGKMQG